MKLSDQIEKKLSIKFGKYAGRKGFTVCVYSDDEKDSELSFGTGAESFQEAFRQIGEFIDKKVGYL